MTSSVTRDCQHPDIRIFDGVRCCLSCGFAIASSSVQVAHSVPSDSPKHRSAKKHYYQRLHYDFGQEMRLLHLMPGHFQDDLEGEIVHANLLAKPRYEAISYTWANENGDDSLSSELRCVGSGSIVKITSNCEAALRRIRLGSVKRVIWLDAICIDQDNIEERNHQVQQMASIYRLAEQVMIYLGEACAVSEKVFKYLANTIVTRSNTSVNVAFPRKRGMIPSSSEVDKFFCRRWFHRVWVLQEVGLARRATVLCGNKSLDWSLFTGDRSLRGTLASFAGLNSPVYSGDIPGVLSLGTDLCQQKLGMVDLLHVARKSHSKDPRDKVFALLSLLNREDEPKIHADYAKTAEWLFTYIAIQSMKDGACLDIMAYVGQSNLTLLPTWVPDWTAKFEEEPLQDQFGDSELSFMGTWDFHVPHKNEVRQNEPSDMEFSKHNLSIQGMEYSKTHPQNSRAASQTLQMRPRGDSVRQVFHLYNPNDHRDLNTLPSRLAVRAHRLATIKFMIAKTNTNQMIVDSAANFNRGWTVITWKPQCSEVLTFWMKVLTRIPDSTIVLEDASVPYAFRKQKSCTTCLLASKDKCNLVRDSTPVAIDSTKDETDSERAWDCCYSIARSHDYGWYSCLHWDRSAVSSFTLEQRRYGRGRKFFRTQGSLGLGPESLRGDEEIWLLENCRVALALRRVDAHYVVVGECYVYGALDAALPCPECGSDPQDADLVETNMIEIW